MTAANSLPNRGHAETWLQSIVADLIAGDLLPRWFDLASIDLDDPLETAGLDSLGLTNLLLEIDQRSNGLLDTDRLRTASSFSELLALIQEHLSTVVQP